MRQIRVENARNRHFGLKILRFVTFLLVAVTPIPPIAVFAVYVHYARDLPDLQPIETYYAGLDAPTTFHSADGMVIGEHFEERRIFLPLDRIPIRLIQAFLAAEDERFFEHSGVDPRSIVRAAVANLTAGKVVQGASTITQQLAKAMLSSDKSVSRKVREAILARRMEDIYSKSEILTLYLNQIFLGHNSYGVQAAAQNYFRKNVSELSLGEHAILAVLPPSPSVVNPIRNLKKTLARRAHVLEMMVKNGFIEKEQAALAAAEPVTVYPLMDEQSERLPYVAEEARKAIAAKYRDFAEKSGSADGSDRGDPEKEWLRHGLGVYTTVEVDFQHRASAALVSELEQLDHKQGYRGPVSAVESDSARVDLLERAREYYLSMGMLRDGAVREGAVYLAIVGPVEKKEVAVTVTPELTGLLDIADMSWAGEYSEFPLVTYDVVRKDGKTLVTKRSEDGKVAFDAREMKAAPADDLHEELRAQELTSAELSGKGERWTIRKRDETARVSWRPKLTDCRKAFHPGDVVLVQGKADGGLALYQQPRVQGAVLSWDPWTGYVRAMVGGTDFDVSQVNRVHSLRQTGSTMKPIYYALAYDMGLRPSYPQSDAPYHRGGFASTGGAHDAGTMLTYFGLVKSRNTVSLRVSEYVTNRLKEGTLDAWRRALGLAHELKGHRAEILGGDQTPWSMSGAFGLFLTGGLRTERTVIRKAVDKYGRVVVDRTFFGDAHIGPRETVAAMYRDLYHRKTRAIRESVAYMMRHELRGVVKSGTATRASKLSRMAAGKTGSLPFDIWFNGFTQEAVTTVWVGADTRERILGRSKSSSGVYGAGPPLSTFIEVAALAAGGSPNTDFLRPVPVSVEIVSVDPKSGDRTTEGGVGLPHRLAYVPLYVHKGEGSTDDVHHSETEF